MPAVQKHAEPNKDDYAKDVTAHSRTNVSPYADRKRHGGQNQKNKDHETYDHSANPNALRRFISRRYFVYRQRFCPQNRFNSIPVKSA